MSKIELFRSDECSSAVALLITLQLADYAAASKGLSTVLFTADELMQIANIMSSVKFEDLDTAFDRVRIGILVSDMLVLGTLHGNDDGALKFEPTVFSDEFVGKFTGQDQ